MVVDAGIIDNGAYPKGIAGIGAGGKFTAEPTQSSGLQFAVAGFMTFPITADNLREFKATRELLKLTEAVTNDGIGGCTEIFGIAVRLAYESLYDAG